MALCRPCVFMDYTVGKGRHLQGIHKISNLKSKPKTNASLHLSRQCGWVILHQPWGDFGTSKRVKHVDLVTLEA
jgi:hypothetical protein